LSIEGHGSLLPRERQKVYAPVPGRVAEILVDHGDRVKKGDLLVRLESKDLEKELEQVTAEERKATSQAMYLTRQADKAQRSQQQGGEMDWNQIQGQLSEAKLTAKSAKERREIIEEQIDSMRILAPQDGIITTWEAKKNLMGRPVEIGTELLQVAGTAGEWICEVEVPDDDMGPILAAQSQLQADIKAGRKKPDETLSAYFIPMTGPEHTYPGFVRRIAPSAETMPETEQYKNRHVVKVTIGFSDDVLKAYLKDNESKEMRPGAEVRARVNCGGTNLAYYLLRKPIQVFYESVLFRWPFLQ
jgi:pyruvate/2-oxoglutarate dehydrogenase complex dihydrolipoamide acyltransferase (E2) component